MAERPSRRDLLRSGAALAATPAVLSACADTTVTDDVVDSGDTGVGPEDTADTSTVDDVIPEVAFDVNKVPLDDVVFTWALSAGGIEPTAAVLVTKVGWTREVLVRVWRETETPGTVLLHFEDLVSPNDGGFVKVPVDNLEPGTRHRYAFFTTDANGDIQKRSPVAQFKTAPRESASPVLKVSVAACNDQATGTEDAFGRIADHDDVDLILHVGDLGYLDGAKTLKEYRDDWAEWLESPGYKRALAHTGIYLTWDDHEVDNNWDPTEVSAQQQAAALQAFTEVVAVVPGEEGRLWRSWRWGKTAEILVLDCRSERDPATAENQDKTDDRYISDEQMTWLKDRLKNSDAHFKIVMNSVPITYMTPWFGVSAGDRWEGYVGQRQELLFHIRDEDIRNVWFVSGDFHVCFLAKVQPNGQGRLADLQEIAVTSGNINPASALLQPPQYAFGKALPRTVNLTFDPGKDQVTIDFLDPEDGSVDRSFKRTHAP